MTKILVTDTYLKNMLKTLIEARKLCGSYDIKHDLNKQLNATKRQLEKAKIEDIKELREKTEASISLCKEALENCNGDIERSIDYIRYKVGIAKDNAVIVY